MGECARRELRARRGGNWHRIGRLTGSPNSMFFNSVQNFEFWGNYFGHPEGSMLGLLGALYQIGSLVSIPIV